MIAVGSHNFGDGKPALDTIADHADVFGCQEAGDRDTAINGFLDDWFGWAQYGADKGGGRGKVPVLFDGNTVTLIDSGTERMGDRTFVGKAGAGPSTMDAKWLTRLLLETANGFRFTFANTHAVPSIYLRKRRELHAEHLRRLTTWAKSVQGPVVIVGDFNATWSHPHFKGLKAAGFRCDNPPGVTHPKTGRRIDLILSRDMTATGGRLLKTTSDHKTPVVTYDTPTPKPPTEDTMVAYLVAHPPTIRQYRDRGTTPSGVIVVHTAESTPDWVGPDTGAEAVASFIQRRTTYGSYHDLCDSDSIVYLVPYNMQAYGDGTGSNPHAYHVSAATQAAKWGQASKEWRDATVRNMAKAAARYAKWLKAEHGIDVPARRITRAQSDARIPGFISHGERDPGRRTDPGAGFPWDDFIDYYATEMGGATTQEDDDMRFDDELYPNNAEKKTTVIDLLRSIDRYIDRSDARHKATLAAVNNPDALADRIAAKLSTEVPAETVKRAVKEALREGVK